MPKTDVLSVNSQVFDLVVHSDIELPELKTISANSPDISLSLQPAVSHTGERDWFHHWHHAENENLIVISVARENRGFRLRFPGLADFLISSDLKSVNCEPTQSTPLETIRHLFLDQVLPRMVGQSGSLVLHASAVRTAGNRGIAFVGESGWGKSTLAGSFRTPEGECAGDDCLMIDFHDDQLIGTPSYQGGRLTVEAIKALYPEGVDSEMVSHYSDKRRVSTASDQAARTLILDAIYFLQDPKKTACDEVLVAPLKGSDVFMNLVRQSFLLDVADTQTTARHFNAIRELISTRSMFFSLCYPRQFSRLQEVRQAALHNVKVMSSFH